MKFWVVCLGLLLTPALQAQNPPFYDNPYSPYHSGITNYPPVYPPQAYCSQFTSNQFSTSDANETISTLSRQIVQLSEEIRLIQSQIQSVHQQSRPVAVEPTTTSDERPAGIVNVILKNGQRIAAQGYAIVGDTVWIMTSAGSVKVALGDLDLTATLAPSLR